MKLRFRDNTLRLRVNRREVETLAAGDALHEHVVFPDNALLTYTLESGEPPAPSVAFERNVIRVVAPRSAVQTWAGDESIGVYFDVAAGAGLSLKVSIEKDLECVDGPLDERDPHAFARAEVRNC